jgi:hypothetical protein
MRLLAMARRDAPLVSGCFAKLLWSTRSYVELELELLPMVLLARAVMIRSTPGSRRLHLVFTGLAHISAGSGGLLKSVHGARGGILRVWVFVLLNEQ